MMSAIRLTRLRSLRQFLLLCSVLALWSCSSVSTEGSNLPLVLQDFNESLRWNNLQVACSLVEPEQSLERNRRYRKVLADVRIMDVELLSLEVEQGGKRASALVQFTWTEEGSLSVHVGTEAQLWVKHGKRWYLKEQRPPEKREGLVSPFVDPQE